MSAAAVDLAASATLGVEDDDGDDMARERFLRMRPRRTAALERLSTGGQRSL